MAPKLHSKLLATPKAKSKIRLPPVPLERTLASSKSSPTIRDLQSSPVLVGNDSEASTPTSNTSQGEAECNSQRSDDKAVGSPPPPPVGSGMAAVRRLRTSSSSAQISPVSVRTKALQEADVEVRSHSAQPSADGGSAELEACSICLDNLSGQPLGVCLGADGKRVCQHYFPLNCLRRVEGARCPQCRVRFHRRAPLPSLVHEPVEWCTLVSSDGREDLTQREVAAVLKVTLLLSPEDVDDLVTSSWYSWTSGEERLSVDSIKLMTTAILPHMPSKTPSGSRGSHQDSLEADDTKLEDGHSRSGIVCSCGQIHVRRGDRVRRGLVESEIDPDIEAGQLGTIARVGDDQESVIVKWDRSPGQNVYTYTWPDPDGLVLAPASFAEVAGDVLQLQKHITNFSSVAAEELLRRVGFGSPEGRALDLLKQKNAELCEDEFRKPPELYHRVRILPDKILIQHWFDSVPPCQCRNPRCSGGIQWSSHAEKHLGREALVLKIDASDDTILVETRGPCKCQIWYPRLALERVHDPDVEDKLLFEVDDRVECKMQSGWEKGVVSKVLWRGEERHGPCPYAVKLHDGSDILVPEVFLIRRDAHDPSDK